MITLLFLTFDPHHPSGKEKVPVASKTVVSKLSTKSSLGESSELTSKTTEISTAASSIVIPRSSLQGIRLRATSPDSDELNLGLLQSLGLTELQVTEVQSAYYEALDRIKQIEPHSVKITKVGENKVTLTFSDQSPVMSGIFQKMKNSLDLAIKDGRAEIIFSNLIRSNSIGYGDGGTMEIFSEMTPDSAGGEFQQIFQKKIWFNDATQKEEFAQHPIDIDYFNIRYKNLLPLLDVNGSNGDF